jgi:hypothetical protein
VQLIRKAGTPSAGSAYFAWTADPAPWMVRLDTRDISDLPRLARGQRPHNGRSVRESLYLVCVHGNRDACCGRFGRQLADTLAGRGYPVWETTHLGGHRFAPNLVILPRGLYYGPVDADGAVAAIEAQQAGTISARGFRGRAGVGAAEA